MATLVDEGVAHGHADAHHTQEGFWRKYVFSQDHKVIGIQYGFTSLLFLLFGFSLMMMMRWAIAYPGKPMPVLGFLFKDMGGVMAVLKGKYAGQMDFAKASAAVKKALTG